MYLIFSSLITEKRLHLTAGTEGLRNRDRVSVAASTVLGLTDLGIEHGDFYLSFDDSTKWAEKKLTSLLENLDFDFTIHPRRLETFQDWISASKRAVNSGQTQVVLFTNDDHVKVTENNEEFKYLSGLAKEAQATNKDITIMVPLSHFPEVHGVIPIAKPTNLLRKFREAPLIPCQVPAVPMILSTEKFDSFWEKDFTKGSRIVGLENPFGPSLQLSDGFYLPPRQELFRHADSYGHIGISDWPFQVLNPNIIVSKDLGEEMVLGKYQVICDETVNQSNLRLTILGEIQSATQLKNASVSMLKCSILRPSFTSLRWILTRYNLSRIEVVKSFIRAVSMHPKFLKSLAKSIALKPFLIFLDLVRKSILLSGSKESEKKLLWFLTYGSSIGFAKLALQEIMEFLSRISRSR
jgi:hypothetical protein